MRAWAHHTVRALAAWRPACSTARSCRATSTVVLVVRIFSGKPTNYFTLLGRGAGCKRLSGAVCGCRCKRRLGHPPQTPGEWPPGLLRPAAAFSAVLPGSLPPEPSAV